MLHSRMPLLCSRCLRPDLQRARINLEEGAKKKHGSIEETQPAMRNRRLAQHCSSPDKMVMRLEANLPETKVANHPGGVVTRKSLWVFIHGTCPSLSNAALQCFFLGNTAVGQKNPSIIRGDDVIHTAAAAPSIKAAFLTCGVPTEPQDGWAKLFPVPL